MSNVYSILKVPEVRTYNQILKSLQYGKFRLSVDSSKEHCINGTNIEVDYSHVLDNTGYQFASAKFFKDYNNFFSDYSYNVQEFDNAQKEAQNEITNTQYILYNMYNIQNSINDQTNTPIVRAIIDEIVKILDENLPANFLTNMCNDLSDVFAQAWKTQHPNNNQEQ